MNIYDNEIRSLARFTEEGVGSDQASICGHFPDHIFVRLQQFPDVETVFMGDLVARATGSEQKPKPCSNGHKRI